MTQSELRKELCELVANLPSTQVQNRLMACPDRQLAIALLDMESDRVESIIARVAESKARRVREELSLAAVRGLDVRDRQRVLNQLVSALRSDRQVEAKRSYLRPRHRRTD